jgi:hypothetical protein
MHVRTRMRMLASRTWLMKSYQCSNPSAITRIARHLKCSASRTPTRRALVEACSSACTRRPAINQRSISDQSAINQRSISDQSAINQQSFSNHSAIKYSIKLRMRGQACEHACGVELRMQISAGCKQPQAANPRHCATPLPHATHLRAAYASHSMGPMGFASESLPPLQTQPAGKLTRSHLRLLPGTPPAL